MPYVEEFTGFSIDTLDFLMELRFNNEKAFFEENRGRYERCLKQPLTELAAKLLPQMLSIDSEFEQNVPRLVSRIRRDTRFSKDKSPYRDHGWIAFKRPKASISESFCIYFEITPLRYGYGMGMYEENTSMMAAIRARMVEHEGAFLRLNELMVLSGFVLEGSSYVKERYLDASPALRPFLNMRKVSWFYEEKNINRLFSPNLTDQVSSAFATLGNMYKLLMGTGGEE